MKDSPKKKLPRFKTEKQEADFWGTHESTEYWDEFAEVEEPLTLDPELSRMIDKRSLRKQLISLRLETWQVRLAKATAAKRGIPYHAVIRNWITAGIQRKGSDV